MGPRQQQAHKVVARRSQQIWALPAPTTRHMPAHQSVVSALATLLELPHPPGSRLLPLPLLLLLVCMLLPASSRPSGRGTGASSGMPALLGSPCKQQDKVGVGLGRGAAQWTEQHVAACLTAGKPAVQ